MRDGLGRGHGLGSSLWWRPRVGGVRRAPSTVHIRSGGRDRQAECATAKARRCVGSHEWRPSAHVSEREFGRCSRPTVRPGRNVHDEGARPRRRLLLHPPARPAAERLADRDLRSRRAVLVGTGRRGPDHEPMPAGRDRPTGQARPRRVHRARRTGRRRWRSGPCHRRCAPPGLPARWREAARPWDAATGALVRRPRRRRCSCPPSPAIAAPAVPGVVSMSVPPPPNGVRGATRAMGRHGRRVARADETRDRRPDVGLRASLRHMVMP